MTAQAEPLPAQLLEALRRFLPLGTPTLLLACSGGRDSTVLVHAASKIWPSAALVVGHVHHGLQPAADDWLASCADLSAGLGLRFLHRRLPARGRAPGEVVEGLEGWARRHRYRALAEMAEACGAGVVLTAHHANDQLETAQLRRMRGAGALGLGAMRPAAPLPGAPEHLLLRPFLAQPRDALVRYAAHEGLSWVEDPSNRDTRHPRNRIRVTLDEALTRDPDVLRQGLAAIDGAQREADVVRAQAQEDLARCRVLLVASPAAWGEPLLGAAVPVAESAGDPAVDPAAGSTLSRAALARLPPGRAAEALRCWLAGQGCRMPSRAKLAEIARQLIVSDSAQGRVRHEGRWLLRYRDRIGSLGALPEPLEPVWFRWAGEAVAEVSGQRFQFLPAGESDPRGVGVDPGWLRGVDLMLDRGHGADRIRLSAAGSHSTWKNLSQQRGVPTWLRPALPVLRAGDAILFAAPFGSTAPAGVPAAGDGAGGGGGGRIVIGWQPPAEWSCWL